MEKRNGAICIEPSRVNADAATDEGLTQFQPFEIQSGR